MMKTMVVVVPMGGASEASTSLTWKIWRRKPSTSSNELRCVILYKMRKPSPPRIHCERSAEYSAARGPQSVKQRRTRDQ